MGFLTDHAADVRRRLERRPLDEAGLMALALELPPARPFAATLRAAPAGAVIAEIKRSSPSAGEIADVDASSQARAYEVGGAAAVSVLTEPTWFGGTLADLRAARRVVGLPVLRKDFLVHPAQVIESRATAADAVLLIAAVLSELELKGMLAAADDLGLGALVETHGEEDLAKVLATDAAVIGVNARDLETLEVDVPRALELIGRVPADRVAVLESGVASRRDVERAVEAGARAALVGEALMRSADPAATLRSLTGA